MNMELDWNQGSGSSRDLGLGMERVWLGLLVPGAERRVVGEAELLSE